MGDTIRASIHFTGDNFKEVEEWCNWYCIPIVGVKKDRYGRVESFTINTEGGLMEIYEGNIIQYEGSWEAHKIDKQFFANY